MLEGWVPWPAETAERYRREGYWQGTTLGDILHEWAERHGDRTALIGGGQRLSYAELDTAADHLAAQLGAQGIGTGDRVVVHLPNVPEFVMLCFALFRLGALPVFALATQREHEITYLCQFTEASAYVVPAAFGKFDYLGLARRLRASIPSLRQVFVAGEYREREFVSLNTLIAEPAAAKGRRDREGWPPAADDIALFLLSGGTTGTPKLIPRTHNDYVYNFRRSAETCGFGPDTVYLVVLPIAHNFPFGCPGALGTFDVGGTVILTPDPNPAAAFPIIQRERVTATALVPTLALRWLDAPERAQHDLSSLRLLQVGGARLAPEAARRVRPKLGCTLQQVFGMAEGLLNYTRLDDPEAVIVETQGRPMSPADETLVIDEEGRPVAPGEAGELLTRGPYTIRGYFRAPEHNAQAFTAEGYYRTGDVVRLHPSGNFVVEGRTKDLINRGGEKISAEEIENFILAHPQVANAAVVAMADAAYGERACAYVILQEGATLSLAKLVAFLRERGQASYKLPERLECVPRFPLTNVGKVNKRELRADIAEKQRQEQAGEAPPAASERNVP